MHKCELTGGVDIHHRFKRDNSRRRQSFFKDNPNTTTEYNRKRSESLEMKGGIKEVIFSRKFFSSACPEIAIWMAALKHAKCHGKT